MLPASNKGVGMNMGFPDVCLTPSVPAPIPIPYPNMAMNAMAATFCPTILLTCMPALNMASIIPMTMGDQPGVAHPFFMQMGRYTMGNPKVLLECLPAINLTCPTSGNMMNNPVGAVLVPSVTTVFFTRRGPLDDGAIADATTHAMLDGGVGYLAIRAFHAAVTARAHHALCELTAAGMDALVVDLRGNPGGELGAFVELAGDFLDPGSVVVTMTDVDGDDTVHRARQPSPWRMPMALLVDGGTASAAELFAACLKAHGRAVVIGERTYGKGVAQALVPTPDGGAVYGTVASFRFADGERVDGNGVTPHLSAAGGDLEAWRASARALMPEALCAALSQEPIAHRP